MTDQAPLNPTSPQPDAEARPQSAPSKPSRPQPSSRLSPQNRTRIFHHPNSSSSSIDSRGHNRRPRPTSRDASVPHSTSHKHGRKSSNYHHQPRSDDCYSSDDHGDRVHDSENDNDKDRHARNFLSGSLARRSFAPWTKPRPLSVDAETTRLLGSAGGLDTYGILSRPPGSSPPKSAGWRPRHQPLLSAINHPSSMPSSVGSPPFDTSPTRTFPLIGTTAEGEIVSVTRARRAQKRHSFHLPSRPQGDDLTDLEAQEPDLQGDLSELPPISLSPGALSARSSCGSSLHRKKNHKAEEDVCFPAEEPSPKATWPDYNVLEEWAADEQKALDEGSANLRSGCGAYFAREGHRKVSEPVMVDGRYRRRHHFPTAVPFAVFCSRGS